MKLKRISAASIKDAMALARKELGEDAVLMDTKKAEGGNVIVTFAIEQKDDLDFSALTAEAENVVPFTPAIVAPTVSKVELAHPALTLIHEALTYHAIPSPLSERILSQSERAALSPDALIDVAENALTRALSTSVRFTPLTLNTKPPKKAMMLVGPHGAGKTSTIAKLATALALNKQPIFLISTDTERMGGAESLETLATLLHCDFELIEKRAALKQLLPKLQDNYWTFIDSTGANIYEFAQLKMLGEFATLQGVEPILTCAAGMDAAEAIEMASVFNFIPIERMCITRLDAVRRLGSVFAAMTTGGYALANFTQSALPTQAPHPITAKALARLMLRHARERMTHERSAL